MLLVVHVDFTKSLQQVAATLQEVLPNLFPDAGEYAPVMSRTRGSLILLAAAPVLLVGCSGPAATTSAPPPAVTSSATPIDASPTAAATSASPTDDSTTTAGCPAGDYTLQSFDVTGADGSLGKGTGGDVSVEFDNGRYEIDFDDDDPISLTIGDATGQLVVDGEIKGTYTGSGDAITFTLGRASGQATLKRDGKSRTLPMSQLAKVTGLSGKGSATCTGDDLTLKVNNGTFELVRDND